MQSNIASRFSSARSVELIPSGLPSLDSVVGGGFPLGSIVLINEDQLGVYSDLFFKLYISEGVVNKDKVFLASPEVDLQSYLTNLPGVVDSKSTESKREPQQQDSMTIAWRYAAQTPVEQATKSLSLSNNFTFSRRIATSLLNDANITKWPVRNAGTSDVLQKLIDDIKCIIEEHTIEMKNTERRSHVRICLHHLGSVLWQTEQSKIPLFLFKLRYLITLFPASVVVSLPPSVFKDEKVLSRCHQLSDVVIQLIAMEPASNSLYGEYDGLLQLKKASPINSLTSSAVVEDDWAFKLTMKRLIVERLTLPPELETSSQREGDKGASFCGSTAKVLDF